MAPRACSFVLSYKKLIHGSDEGRISFAGRAAKRIRGFRMFDMKKQKSFDFCFGSRRRPNLPGRCQPSTFGAKRLNFCVRDGYRWCPLAIVTGMLRVRAFALPLGSTCASPRLLRASAFAFAPSKPHSGKLTCKVLSVFLSLALSFRFTLASRLPLQIKLSTY